MIYILKRNLLRKKQLKTLSIFILFIALISFILVLCVPSVSFALGDPKLISTINNAFEDIEGWILKIATPAAAVAVGTGVFMKKFSFGDEEKIRTGKKLIKGS